MNTQQFNEVLSAIKKCSMEDIANLTVRQSSVKNGQIADIYPEAIRRVCESLHIYFTQPTDDFISADDLLPLIRKTMQDHPTPEEIDHQFLSKITILEPHLPNSEDQFSLCMLHLAGNSIRYEQKFHMDLEHLTDTDKQTMAVDQAQQEKLEHQFEKELSQCTEQINLQKKCSNYMQALATIIYDKMQVKPASFKHYLEPKNLSSSKAHKDPMTIMAHLIKNHHQEIQEDSHISPSIKFALKQYNAVTDLYQILNDSNVPVNNRLNQFRTAWNHYQQLLQPKNAYINQQSTLMKIAGTILSLGAATPYIWKKDEEKLVKRAGKFFDNTISPPSIDLENETRTEDDQNRPSGSNV